MTDKLTEWLSNITGTDPETIEREAREMYIESPEEADWELIDSGEHE